MLTLQTILMSTQTLNNKRIAKNTLLLYIRTLLLVIISLYTSRVVLEVLGVEDYGIYNVVGGVVSMFSMISGSLSSSISRYITFELGRGDIEKLRSVFSSSVNIQVGIALLVFVLGEVAGKWFIDHYINLPIDRLEAASCVLHCSLVMFCINLISLPYNASIIAHEHMKAFAHVSILEGILKLLICYLIVKSPFDKLVSYSLLLVIVALIIRIIYGVYCKRYFAECHYKWIYNPKLLKEMMGFAGWSFMTNVCYILNTQGVNILINMFFGVALNAARGIATQVDGIIMQFVGNFTMAINPQITKSYAIGEKKEMFNLVCRGAKFGYYMLLFLALPLLLETEFVLNIWLKEVPDYTVIFLRLTIIASMINTLGNTGYTACMATGTLKRYVLVISSVGFLVFPLTWIAFKLGLPVESAYIAFIIVYAIVLIVRLYLMKGLIAFPPTMFVKNVILSIFVVSVTSVLLPITFYHMMSESFLRFVTTCIVCTLSSGTSIYFLGLTIHEKKIVTEKLIQFVHKIPFSK